jgi:endonuclease/exonuclease/phosphatase family metal-dependent hydrolase
MRRSICNRWAAPFGVFGAILMIGVFSTLAVGQAMAEVVDLRAMSFNVRFSRVGSSEKEPENNWADPQHPRRERAIRIIREINPDLLGVQEARELQVKDFEAALPEYEFYGVGRDDGKMDGEFSGIFFRKDRFAKKDSGSFWLSDTPETVGTTFSYNKLPRIASWVKLVDNKSKREFVLLNMHWDHQDKTAREKAATLVRERLAAISQGKPLLVMGDLNSNEDTKAFTTLLGADANDHKLADSYREVHPERSPEEASFDNWKGTTKGSRIDFILHTSEFKPTAAAIERTSYEGFWPSDHYPVTATLQIDSE